MIKGGEDGKLVVNKKEAKVIQLIYNLFLKGLSFYQIKKELDKDKSKHLLVVVDGIRELFKEC